LHKLAALLHKYYHFRMNGVVRLASTLKHYANDAASFYNFCNILAHS